MLQNVVVEKSPVNTSLLDEQLRAALGSNCVGISVSLGDVTVHLDDPLTQQVDEAREIVRVHDSRELSTQQIEDQLLVDEREQNVVVLDVQTVTLIELARRVAWLTEEVHRLVRDDDA